MEYYKGFKTQIYPNDEQIEYFDKCFSISRYAYNWYIRKRDFNYKNGIKQSYFDLQKDFTKIRNSQGYEWLLETNNKVVDEALKNCKKAYDNFFNGIKSRPKYKSENDAKQIFSSSRCLIDSNAKHLRKKKYLFDGFHFYIAGKQTIPGVTNGYFIKTAEDISFLKNKKVILVSISKENNKYYVGFTYKENSNYVNNSTQIVGIDIGIKTFATQSDEKIAKLPKKIDMYYERIDKLNQVLSKKQKGSNNYEKVKIKINKYYRKIKDLKMDFCHKYTTYLAKNYNEIKIEDVSVQEWFEKKDIKLSKNLQKSCLGLFREQLEYKCEWYNSKLTKIDKYYPSSKTCSCCGNVKQDLKLSDRVYKCEKCGFEMDRDLNAAINILNYSALNYSRILNNED
jgi:putative transposase